MSPRHPPPDTPTRGLLLIRDVLSSVIEPATMRAYKEGHATLDDALKLWLYEYAGGKVFPGSDYRSCWDHVSPAQRRDAMRALAKGKWRQMAKADRRAHMQQMARARWKKARAAQWQEIQAAARVVGVRVRARVWPLEED